MLEFEFVETLLEVLRAIGRSVELLEEAILREVPALESSSQKRRDHLHLV